MGGEGKDFNKVILHPAFHETIKELRETSITFPSIAGDLELDYHGLKYPPEGEFVTVIDEIGSSNLDAKAGQDFYSDFKRIAAYDESINKFMCLEGSAFLTSHSIVLLGETDYLPANLLTIYFYTSSSQIAKSPHIKETPNPTQQSMKDYVTDKLCFLRDMVPEKYILLIDGPLIGGDYYQEMVDAAEDFVDKDIIPVFFVKNSSSNLVTQSIPELRGKYNSDLHWAHTFLKKGQYTNFFQYRDRHNPGRGKVFSYIKTSDSSPQRVEFHVETLQKYGKLVPDIMNLIYYLIIAQGDMKNPQVRPVAVAEKYARATLHLVDLERLIRAAGLTPTMNQERFAW